ncbi:hypothetical protein NMG60_11028180 [Bertholletia excelsa]
MRHGRQPLRRSFGSYEGSFELILVMGSNPTWRDLIHSKLKNSE